MIIASCVCLGLDSPRLPPESTLASALRTLDYLWLIVFSMEMVIKLIAYSLITGPTAYLKSAWNILDMSIVLASLAVLIAEAHPDLLGPDASAILRGPCGSERYDH